MSAVLHCTEDIIHSTRSLQSKQDIINPATKDLASVQPVLSSCIDYAQTILYCVEQQKRIIDDVLTLLKLDANLLEIALVPVEPRKVLHNALRIFDRELKDLNIKLTIVEEPSLDALNIGLLMLDPNRLLQTIINMVTNRIKFTKTSLHEK
jgi:signal transduction histidine kinase